MAPLPKRKHSTRRKGKGFSANVADLPKLVKCPNCGKEKLPQRVCKYCGR